MNNFPLAQLVDGLSYWHWELLLIILITVPNVITFLAFRKSRIRLVVTIITAASVVLTIVSLAVPPVGCPLLLCALVEIIAVICRMVYVGFKNMDAAVKRYETRKYHL